MNDRIRALRKELGLTQEKFADRLSMKRNTIANYEIGRNEPIDAVVSLICKEFNVSEEWLRTGTGEMFKPLPEEDETAAFVSDLLEDGDNELYVMIKEIMRTYDQLDEKSKAVIKQFSRSLLENIKKQGG
ncbi:helix-turn-helix domain-containing protein [Clostridiales Family XIII bacterium ASD5510]|uniref:Helix-turn-helix domain-containing protein n=1 Tax=Hominibacterium faecale TaxID=2839743 RepID=A0A9J6QRV3_9FIRM|nr:helix-turn-helix domain-containing protein [Hominibacterium faecale]MCU7378164.1 helix-turn-helix domain-containing protein [Hominibacterium faecale]